MIMLLFEVFVGYILMMQQYLCIKVDYLDMFVFYWMGDFYELFFEDVEKVVCLFDLIFMQCGVLVGILIKMVGVLYYVVE